MTPPWATCHRCERDLYPRLARPSEVGWICADRKACSNRARATADNDARAEDVRWLAQTGESAVGAAARLGIGMSTLEKFCYRHGLGDELRQLAARNPRDHNAANMGAAIVAKFDRRRAA